MSRKFASWSGEQIQLEREIPKITAMAATLEKKRSRVERLSVLIRCSQELMSELDPDWDPAAVKPSPPHQRKLPYANGMVTRWAMQLIREANAPFSSVELAEKIVEMRGGDRNDPDLLDRVRDAINTSLRKKLGRVCALYTDQAHPMGAHR